MPEKSIRDLGMAVLSAKCGPWSGAMPYARALLAYESIEDRGAREAVTAFLESAKSWRGTHARSVKRALRNMIAERDE